MKIMVVITSPVARGYQQHLLAIPPVRLLRHVRTQRRYRDTIATGAASSWRC